MTAGFKMEKNTVRQCRYLDPPSHEPAFGVTIHKRQGSEFETVLIVILDRLFLVVTRQLLYTGVTRAREKAIILGSMGVIEEAMDLSVKKTFNVSCLLSRELGSNAPDPVMGP